MQNAPAMSQSLAASAAGQTSTRPIALRLLGAALLTLGLVPVYRLLDDPETGLAGAVTVQLADALRDFSMLGILIAFAGALILGRFWLAIEAQVKRAGAWLVDLPRHVFLAFCAFLAGVAALLFSMLALHGQPNLIDTVSQLVHARYLAIGQLAGPSSSAFWHLQQTLATPNGWVSQYPPGHVGLLAIGIALRAEWLVGPIMLGLTVWFVGLSAERLLPNQRAAARLGVVLVALSPFLIAHAGAYMSHTSAAAFSALAVYAAVRGDFRGRFLWLTGGALGALFLVRPLTALTLGAVLAAFTVRRDQGWTTNLGSVAMMGLAAAPFGLLAAAYNAHFFGSPFRFGYEAALGPAGSLGFGVDPWGNTYGLRQAFAYTSAELSTLGLSLLESPVPSVLIVGAFLVSVPRLERGERLLVAWACAPLLANLFYWHHGIFMGPRMLNEYAPAWCLLVARGATALPARMPDDREYLNYTPRALTGSFLLIGLGGLLLLAPMRLRSLAVAPSATRAALASVRAPALVFVHGGWEERVGMRLAASGMRLDSVETALRQNSTCSVQLYADARAVGRPLPQLDFERRATGLPARRAIAPGSFIRDDGRSLPSPVCTREMAADRFGVVDPAMLLMHGDLPGAPANGVMLARDFGPARNADLIAAEPDRDVLVLRADARSNRVLLEPYAAGMSQLWRSLAAEPLRP